MISVKSSKSQKQQAQINMLQMERRCLEEGEHFRIQDSECSLAMECHQDHEKIASEAHNENGGVDSNEDFQQKFHEELKVINW